MESSGGWEGSSGVGKDCINGNSWCVMRVNLAWRWWQMGSKCLEQMVGCGMYAGLLQGCMAGASQALKRGRGVQYGAYMLWCYG
jgi:hypothetical protein